MFSISKYINIPLFLTSLVIGIIVVIFFMDDKKTIVVYPTPENIDIIQYKDSTDSCYNIEMVEVKCPANKKLIHRLTPQVINIQ